MDIRQFFEVIRVTFQFILRPHSIILHDSFKVMHDGRFAPEVAKVGHRGLSDDVLNGGLFHLEFV